MKTAIEKELKRYIPEDVSKNKILNFLRLKYPILEVKTQKVWDAYFKLNLPKGYTLRIREVSGKLKLTLKSNKKRGIEGILERVEECRITKISERLNITSVRDLTEFSRLLQQKYGIRFIVKQIRTKILVNGVEVSLDTVEYFLPLSKTIPPIKNAAGKLFKKLKIYEAEIKKPSYEQLAKEITDSLYQKGLVGEICSLSKKDLGEIFLANFLF